MADAHAPPPNAPPPPPYFPPPYSAQGPAAAWWTQQGLMALSTAAKCAMAASVLYVVFGLLAYEAFPVGTKSAFDDANAGASAVDLVASLLSLAALAYGVSAVGKIRRGKAELGAPHEQSVKRAVMFLVGAVLLGAVSAGASIFVSFGSGFEAALASAQGRTLPPAGPDFYLGLQLSLFPAAVAVALLAFFMDGVLVSLLSDKARILRLLFYALSFSSAVAEVALGLWLMQVLPPLQLNVLQIAIVIGVSGLASALTIPAMVVYLKMVKDATETVPAKLAAMGRHSMAWPQIAAPPPPAPPAPREVR